MAKNWTKDELKRKADRAARKAEREAEALKVKEQGNEQGSEVSNTSHPSDIPSDPGANPSVDAGNVRHFDPPASNGGGVGGDTASTRPRTGSNLEDGKGRGRPIKVVFDAEKIRKGFPGFTRMFIRALSNLSRGVCQIPAVPFVIEFQEPTETEAETFSETVWPGVEAAMPSAIARAPFVWMFGAFVVLLVGQFRLMMKVVKKATEKEQGNDGGSEKAGGNTSNG